MLSRYNKSKSQCRDIPSHGPAPSVKGREVRVIARYEAPTRGTGKRWGNGLGKAPKPDQVWRYVCPVTGKVTFASTKPKGKDRAQGWHKWK